MKSSRHTHWESFSVIIPVYHEIMGIIPSRSKTGSGDRSGGETLEGAAVWFARAGQF
jgi:hypothetical protein